MNRAALASLFSLALSACANGAATPSTVTLAIPPATSASAPIVTSSELGGTKHRPEAADPEMERKWAGVWLDPSTAYKTCMTIELRKGAPTVVSSIEAVGDKETYEVKSQSWDGETLSWSHYVPSTKYLVTYVCVSTEANSLHCTWSNDHQASGKEELRRIPSRDEIPPDEPDPDP